MRGRKLDSLGVSAFCESMAMMVQSGIQMDEAVALLKSGGGQGGCLEDGLVVMQAETEAGKGLSVAMEAAGIFPEYAVRMVAAGESAGRLEDVLFQLARYYADQKAMTDKLKNSVLYPVAMLAIIIVVLAVMLTMVLPAFTDVYDRLTGSMAASSYSYVRWAYVLCWAALAVMLVLFGLIVRAVSFEFRAGDPAWGKLWDGCFFVGSLLPALLLGVAVGNIFAGIPMDEAGNYAGVPLLGLITPFTLLTGLLGLVMFLAAGAAWAALKAPLPSELQARAAALRMPLQVIALALFAVVSVFALALVGQEMDPNLAVLRWLFAALVVVGLGASIAVGRFQGDDAKAFLAQSAAMIALVALLACSMFPTLVNAVPDSVGPAITLANAASSELSLTWMTIILCVGLPLVLAYHVIIYRTFRGRVKPEDLTHY